MSGGYAEILKAFQKGNSYQPSISSVVFPNYKNVQAGEELTLDFPLTLLLGKNGTNKSSILHALYGCPGGKSTGEYWFSTHVDPISGSDRPAYFYRYQVPGTSNMAEVLKTMIKKKQDPEYWEPSRPVLDYGMKPLPKVKTGDSLPEGMIATRWKPIEKEVLYLDFRAEISAFDKAFYKDQHISSRPQHRAKLRRWSKPLKHAIDSELQNRTYYQKERIFKNYTFQDSERACVNQILGTNYNRIVYIEHDFYHSRSFSVYLTKNEENNYSEAFAGSGETSVVRLVYALENALEKALVLLDEPETSLHIEAQYRLREYIMEKIKSKKLQVVISTHSPFFAKGLPECAIKVLNIDDSSKKVRIINSAPAEESSFHLGYRRNEQNKVQVYVEDSAAKVLCVYVANKILEESEREVLSIQHYVGGKEELLKLAASESTKPNSNLVFLFDGDYKPSREIPDPDTIPISENHTLEQKILDLFNITNKALLKFPQDSNQPDQKYSNLRNFLRFARDRVQFLPCQTPEEFLVKECSDITNKNFSSSKEAKDIIKDHAESVFASSGNVKAEEILNTQRALLNRIEDNHSVFTETAQILRHFKQFAPSSQSS